jgi:hypothetical protein
MLPEGYETIAFPCPLYNLGIAAPHVVAGFAACLGVPMHYSNDQYFITDALKDLGVSHDWLLDLVEAISEEDPFATRRLLQVYRVTRFGHVLSAVPPHIVGDFGKSRD